MADQSPSWEILVLRLLATRGAGRAALSRLLARLPEPPPSPSELAVPAESLVAMMHEPGIVAPDVLTALLGDRAEAPLIQMADALREQGVQILLRGAAGYPSRFGGAVARPEKSPPVLFVQGALPILNLPAVGFCGSRHATERGLTIAAECAAALAGQGLNVVSGHAGGVDQAVHESALRCGVTTLVLPEGILGFRPRRGIAALARSDSLLIVSEFSPRLPWSAGNAMARNHTICGLSGALIVIEARETGGSLAAGQAALDQGLPLFVVDYAGLVPQAAGNASLLSKGGLPLRRRPSGEPNLDRVVAAARSSR